MTTPNKSAVAGAVQREHENLLMIVGQLLEATKAASDGIKSLNSESRQNAQAVLAAAKTLEMVEDLVSDLNRVVRTGNGVPSLVSQVSALRVELEAVKEKVKKQGGDHDELRKQVDGLDEAKHAVLGMKSGVVWVVGVVVWLATMALSIYGAFKK